MSNLDNLTAKIIADSEAQARQILDKAKAEAGRLAAEFAAEIAQEKEKLLADAGLEAARTEEQLVMGKTLAVRDENLAAKQNMLDRVFSEALTRLNNMPKEEFLTFLTGYLVQLELDGEELVLPEKYGITNIDPINTALQAAGKKGNLVLSTAKRQIDGGFVLCKDGIEQNNTFAAMIAYYRYELESEVIAALY